MLPVSSNPSTSAYTAIPVESGTTNTNVSLHETFREARSERNLCLDTLFRSEEQPHSNWNGLNGICMTLIKASALVAGVYVGYKLITGDSPLTEEQIPHADAWKSRTETKILSACLRESFIKACTSQLRQLREHQPEAESLIITNGRSRCVCSDSAIFAAEGEINRLTTTIITTTTSTTSTTLPSIRDQGFIAPHG